MAQLAAFLEADEDEIAAVHEDARSNIPDSLPQNHLPDTDGTLRRGRKTSRTAGEEIRVVVLAPALELMRSEYLSGVA